MSTLEARPLSLLSDSEVVVGWMLGEWDTGEPLVRSRRGHGNVCFQAAGHMCFGLPGNPIPAVLKSVTGNAVIYSFQL